MKLYKAYFVTLDEYGEYEEFLHENDIIAKNSQQARDKAIALRSSLAKNDVSDPGTDYDVIIKEIG